MSEPQRWVGAVIPRKSKRGGFVAYKDYLELERLLSSLVTALDDGDGRAIGAFIGDARKFLSGSQEL